MGRQLAYFVDGRIHVDNTDKRIRVLLWSPGGAGEHYHGPGTFAYRMYMRDGLQRFRLTLVHGCPTQGEYPLYEAQHMLGGAEGAWGMTCFLRRAKSWIKENARSFDVFHGVTAYETVVRPARQAQLAGIPAIVRVAGHGSDLADKGGWRNLLRFPRRRREWIKEMAGVIAISGAIKGELLEYGMPESKIALIPNGVNTEVFRPVGALERKALREELSWVNRPTVLFVGRLTRRKRPMVLVEAIGLLAKAGREVQAVFVGPEDPADEYYTRRLHARIDELGLGDRMIFTGFQRQTARYYAAADLFVLPSQREGMPNALLEAMASGLPALVTPVSGSEELVVDGETGRWITPDASELAEHLNDYLAKPQVAMRHGRAARERVVKQFSLEATLSRYEQLFCRVIAGGDANM